VKNALTAQAQADLAQQAPRTERTSSKWWDKLQREWNEQMTSIRKAFEKDRSTHDAKKAAHRRSGRRGRGVATSTRMPIEEADTPSSTPKLHTWKQLRRSPAY
jgi:hypothetical protein